MRQPNGRRSRPRARRAPLIAGVAVALSAVAVAACTVSAEPEERAVPVTLVVDGSWQVPKALIESFEGNHDIDLVIREAGTSSGALADRLVAAKGKAIGDVAFGVYDSDLPRVLDDGVFDPYTSPEANKGPQRYAADRRQRVSAVDIADVCVNSDTEWFADAGVDPPETLGDLLHPRYRDLLVVPSPVHSAEGSAFLLATVARFGADGWRSYWSKLKANGVRVVDRSAQAYQEEFTGGTGAGSRPLVVASALSPATQAGERDPHTAVAPDTCYRRVRYAGVLAGAEHPVRAGKVVDFLLSQQFQAALAQNQGTYPARERVPLPDGWDRLAPQPVEPYTLPAEQVQQHQRRWLSQWRALMAH